MLTLIYLLAISAEAMTGALAAGRRNMDIFGVSVIAFLTALGGGTVRDILLGRYPIAWTQHPEYVALVIASGIAAVLISRHMKRLNRLFMFLDALGLIAFTIIGCDVALEMNYHPLIVLLSGMITGIAGGILRDMLCNRVPIVFFARTLRQRLDAGWLTVYRPIHTQDRPRPQRRRLLRPWPTTATHRPQTRLATPSI
ncbi:trimeric intracellular cation channel family protein [Deefgea sp. CFH1-16]|uniref:trimeric intracellular cation channel family protein n=1 Tax=Deefgea sp. CFH1-16 TaxID=2675457 RepID=UPI001B355762|nr:trimeric intracellular cation channel family protein [Deefgea sp. CFH1-16]